MAVFMRYAKRGATGNTIYLRLEYEAETSHESIDE